MNALWPATDHATLVHLWERTSMSASHIAALMGRTKNAVMGRVDRQGLSLRGKPRIAVTSQRKTVTFPPRGKCRWLEDGVFCAEPGDPWCDAHRARVYVPAKPYERKL
jgi:hypothetical protein